MTELGPDAKSLFASARRDLSITSEERERTDLAVATKLGLGAGAAATLAANTATASLAPAAGGAAGAAAAAATGLGVKVVGTAALLAVVGAGGAVLLHASRRSDVSTTTTAPTSVPAAPPTQALPRQPAVADAPSAELPPAVETSRPPVSSPRKTLAPAPSTKGGEGAVAAEARLVREADAALRNGDAVRALAMLDEHARSYPDGVFREERSAERVFALCKLGRVAEARTQASRFLRDSRSSPLAASVRASCGGSSEGP